MKRLGSHKWFIVMGAIVVIISMGAVACSSADADQAGAGQGMRPEGQIQPGGGNAGDTGTAAGQTKMAERRQAMKERRDARADRREALVEKVRDEMSAQDQAQYDSLTASVKSQQEALQDARQELADTLKELRALVDKYLDLDTSGGN